MLFSVCLFGLSLNILSYEEEKIFPLDSGILGLLPLALPLRNIRTALGQLPTQLMASVSVPGMGSGGKLSPCPQREKASSPATTWPRSTP